MNGRQQPSILPWRIGLITVVFASYKAVFGRHQSFLQPDIACMLFMWGGYHLSPIIALVSGKNWRAFMLSPEHIEHGLWMSLTSTYMFTFGYRCLMTGQEKQLYATQSWSERATAILRKGSRIRKWYLWIFSGFVAVIFVVISGGIDQVWEASYMRGEGNWVEHTFEVRVYRFLAVILPLASLALIALATILSTTSEKSLSKTAAIAVSFLAVSLNPLHGFSRSAGIAFLCFAIIRFVLLGKRDWRIFIASFAIAFWLSYVGYQFRSEYRPGIGSFVEAAGRSLTELPEFESSKPTNDEWIVPEDNFMSAVEPYTAVVSYVEYQEIAPFSDILEFIFNLHPFPSGFIPLADRGVDLTGLFGMRTGWIDDPDARRSLLFLWAGDTDILFWAGDFVLLYARACRRFGPSVETVLLLLLFLGWPLAGHSAFRAQWRVINLVLITLVFLYILKRRGYFAEANSGPRGGAVMTMRPNRV